MIFIPWESKRNTEEWESKRNTEEGKMENMNARVPLLLGLRRHRHDQAYW